MKINLLISLSFLMVGCMAIPAGSGLSVEREELMGEARASLGREEYYAARQKVQDVLDRYPDDFEAQELMAEVLEKEIAGQKEAFETGINEELNPEERSREAKTWLERAEMLLHRKNYGEAMAAAEKVFVYDPDNLRASELLDKIRKEVHEEGKEDSVYLQKMYAGESEERVKRYKEQARRAVEEGRWGAARLAVEKILLLAPRDKEALRLHDQIQSRES